MTKILFSSCGANQVSYDTLTTIPVKRLSPTHYPVEHYKVIDALMKSLQAFGDFNITNATYGISHKGERIFCIIEVDTSSKDYKLVFIMRNSNDMAFSLMIGCGAVVGICSNMQFEAEFKLEQGCKHTKNIMDTFEDRSRPVIGKLFSKSNSLHEKYDYYKKTVIGEKLLSYFLIDAMNKGGLKKTKIDKVYNEFKNPSYKYEGERNSVWQLLQASTHVNKGLNYVDQIDRSQKFIGVLDNYFFTEGGGETRQVWNTRI